MFLGFMWTFFICFILYLWYVISRYKPFFITAGFALALKSLGSVTDKKDVFVFHENKMFLELIISNMNIQT